MRGPFYFHRVDAFEALHLASYEAVRAVLPTDDLFPVRWFDGRAVVEVAAFRYHEVSGTDLSDGEPGRTLMVSPYGEVGVSALVTRRPLPKGVPLLSPSMAGVGGFVLHLPVTTREARDGGVAIFGLPKFVADMDFTESPTARTVTVSEDGAEVLTLTVRPGGPVVAIRALLNLYSVLDGRLLETTIKTLGHRQGRVGHAAGELTLGTHPVGQALRSAHWRVSLAAVATAVVAAALIHLATEAVLLLLAAPLAGLLWLGALPLVTDVTARFTHRD